MADLEPVSPLIAFAEVAELAEVDQLLVIRDPAGTPSLGRVPFSGLDNLYARADGSNIGDVETWHTSLRIEGVVQTVADEAERLALAGTVLNKQRVRQLDTKGVWELVDDTAAHLNVNWVLLGYYELEWDTITGKPVTFPPEAHTQSSSTITDFEAAVLALAQGAVPAAGIDNVATFDTDGFVQDSGVLIDDVIVEGDARLTDARTPTAHTHPFSDVTGDIDIGQFPVGAANQFLRINLAGTAIEWVSIPGGGDLLSTNDLSDLADAATARQNLGVEIGFDVQAWDSMLDSIGALTAPAADRILFYDFSSTDFEFLELSANLTITLTTLDVASTVMLKSENLSGLANTAISRTNLGVTIGTDVQAHDPMLDDIGALTDPGADRLMFWDDSAGEIVWLTAGTGLTITGTTIDASVGVTDHGALTGLTDDDHVAYLLASGLREWDEQGADPSTPAATKWALYFKAGGLYYIDDAGAVIGPLGSGGGDITTDPAWAAAGDLIVATANNAASVLSVGSEGDVLTVVSGVPDWAAPSGGGGVGDMLYLFNNYH